MTGLISKNTFTKLEGWIGPAALDVLEDSVLPFVATGAGILAMSWMGSSSKANAIVSLSFGYLARQFYGAFKQQKLAERNEQTIQFSDRKAKTALIVQGKAENTRVFAANLEKISQKHRILADPGIRTEMDLNQVLSNAGSLDAVWIRGAGNPEGIRLKGALALTGRSHTAFDLLKMHLKKSGKLILEPGGVVDFAEEASKKIPQAKVYFTERPEAAFKLHRSGTPHFIDPAGQDVTRLSRNGQIESLAF